MILTCQQWRDSYCTCRAPSNLPQPLSKQLPDLLFIRHPLAECCSHSTWEFTLNDLLSFISISGYNGPETRTHLRHSGIAEILSAAVDHKDGSMYARGDTNSIGVP